MRRLECCSSDFEKECCTYYGEKRESGAALLPPTSLIAANKRDYLPDACFYRGTDESSRLYPGSKRQSDKRASCTIYNNGAH